MTTEALVDHMHDIRELVSVMEQIAPTRHAEAWDNVGLIVGDESAPLRGILLTIDYTPAVAEEARRANCSAIISYHPPIFDALKRVTGSAPASQLIFEAIRDGMAIYSPHTALDV